MTWTAPLSRKTASWKPPISTYLPLPSSSSLRSQRLVQAMRGIVAATKRGGDKVKEGKRPRLCHPCHFTSLRRLLRRPVPLEPLVQGRGHLGHGLAHEVHRFGDD